MLNSYNPYNVIALDMSSKDKANNKAYMGTRLFPISFYTTTNNGNVIPNAYDSDMKYALYTTVEESQNYDYSEAQLENITRTGSFLVVPWLITYGLSIWNFESENLPELITELQGITQYAAENNLVLNENIGDFDTNSNNTGFVVGIAADGTLHVLALDLQPNSDGDSVI